VRRILILFIIVLIVVTMLLSLIVHRSHLKEYGLVPVKYSAPPIGYFPWDKARGFIRARGTRFFFDDGTPFFAIGVNYEGWYDRCWRMWEDDLFDPELIERDFIKMRWLGINTVRIFVQKPLADDILKGDWRKLDKVIEIAKKYRIFLLITFWDYHASLDEAIRVEELIARRYANETIIFGYDLKNEPQINFIVNVKRWQDFLKEKYGNIEELDMVWSKVNPKYGLTDVEMKGFHYIGLPKEAWDSPRWADFMKYLNEELKDWIEIQLHVIRKYDKNHMVTVGYNDVRLALLPANELLDFISIHTYFNELDERKQRPSLMILDVIQAVFPNKPVVYEEFGLSSHIGNYVISASKEATIYFYTFFKGLAGAFKWMLNDHILNSNPYEKEFGIFTLKDKKEFAKPIAFAIRAFSRIVAKTLTPPPLKKKIQLIDNPACRLQSPWEYCAFISYLPLYGYKLSPSEGDIALYPASCYGLKSVEEEIARLLMKKPIIFIRLIRDAISFDPDNYETFNREDIYRVTIMYSKEEIYYVNKLSIKVIPEDVPLAINGEPVIVDDDGKPLANRYGNAIFLPFINVLSKLPLDVLVSALEKIGLREPTHLGTIEICASRELPLAFKANTEYFKASFSKEGYVFVPYTADREGIIIGIKEGDNVLLYTTVEVIVKTKSCEVIYGVARKIHEGWILGPGEYNITLRE